MIIKQLEIQDRAVVGCHVMKKAEFTYPADSVSLTVHSFISETAYINGAAPVWNTIYMMPIAEFSMPLQASVEGWLTTHPDSIFIGGTIVADTSITLDGYKLRRWAVLKDARTTAESAPFTCDSSVYQADKERISGAVQLALIAQLASQPFSIDWTLSDNTVKTLDAAQVIAVGVALGTVVSAIFDTARSLREQLDAATTIEQVDAIRWPV